jgi:hypothetical protein
MTDSGEQISDPLRGNDALTAAKMLPTPEVQQEVGGQYPTKPFTPPAMGPQQAAGQEPAETSTKSPSPMTLAGGIQAGATGAASPEQLQTQTSQLQQKSGNLNDMLMERYPTLSDGQKSLVGTKLNKYQSQTAKAGQLLGVKPPSDEEKQAMEKSSKQKAGGDSTLTSFLSMITGGDTTLRGIAGKLSQSSSSSLDPVTMLRAQGALSSASQAVNLATAVIGQGLSFVKTIMQTQI